MSVADFVEQEFGQELRKKLERIGTGGASNEKGSKYESFFAVAKICSAVATSLDNSKFDNFSVSSQETAFVDDICYKVHDLNEKTNYQAKNSSGAAGSWTKDIEARCAYQQKIDLNYHAAKVSKNVLLVSSKSKCQRNLKKIPLSMRTFCFCEHFPYLESSVELILAHKPLRKDLETICSENNLQTLDTAFKIIHSAWATSSSKAKRTVGDIVGEAKKMSRPNIFHALVPERQVPQWMMEKCATFKECNARVESGIVYVRYNGLELSVPNAPDVLIAAVEKELQAIKKVNDFIQWLTDFTKQSLT
ncbi:hypothetical protein [Serratia marcescens]|uniref:hypothetical protein n=1 Tax=Serratia marcescens TaxID=615 RepID=UPI00237FE51B|nr:hypothetical protein [Serratia marcescens]HEJ8101637.1 hypothetical protein [Serratia marcescens]